MQTNQVSKFNQLATDWWNPEGSMGPLHRINPLRSLFLDTAIPLSGKALLDVGCGGGLFAESMAARGAKVTAIDPAKDLIEIAKTHLSKTRYDIDYRIGEISSLAEKEELSYDIVCCLEVLEHVENPATLVRQCARYIKPGGIGYFSTINRTAKSYMNAIIFAEYVLRWLPRNTHAHSDFIKPAELGHHLADCGLNVTDIQGISYSPLHREFYLSDDVDVNYLLLAKKNNKTHA